MTEFYKLEPPNPDIRYWGNSDLLAQITDQLRNHPDSCFSKNVIAWYNSAYAQSNDDTGDCSYQVEINQLLCLDKPPPSSLEEVIQILLDYSSGKNRRIALAALRIIFREAIRIINEQTSASV